MLHVPLLQLKFWWQKGRTTQLLFFFFLYIWTEIKLLVMKNTHFLPDDKNYIFLCCIISLIAREKLLVQEGSGICFDKSCLKCLFVLFRHCLPLCLDCCIRSLQDMVKLDSSMVFYSVVTLSIISLCRRWEYSITPLQNFMTWSATPFPTSSHW